MIAPGLFLYIARRFLFFFALAAVGIGICVFLVDVVELLRRSADSANFSFAFLLKMAVLHFPFLFEQALPFTVLVAAIATYATLTGSNELIALRASGVSAWQFIAPSVVAVLALGLLAVTLLNPLATFANERFEALEAKRLTKSGTPSSLAEEGLWIKEGQDETYTIIHVGRFLPRSQKLAGIMLFFFVDGEYYARVDAETAEFQEDGWRLKSAWLTPLGEQPIAQGGYFYGTELSADKIKENLTRPEQVSFWQYAEFIGILRQAGLDTKAHAMRFGSLLVKPLFLTVMLLLGIIFSLRTARRGHRALFIALGILSAAVFYIFTQFLHRLGVSGGIPIALAAAVPIFIGGTISSVVLAQIEDG